MLTSRQREQLTRWTSLAQWIGTDKGADAVAKVEAAWPGYASAANASILNAYYTDPKVIDTVWAWLRQQGVTQGHGFEPGCGRGDWMAAAPRQVTFDAVDIDPISVRIAGLLTRRNVVESRIEEWDLSRSSRPDVAGYDVVVGNVPFSSIKPGVNNPHRDNLHNLAVARAVDMLRPGGITAVLTSRYALDADASRGWRQRLADQVDLVGAFRLPHGTHKEAGTAVVTDLLILRRPLPGEPRPHAAWVDTVEVQVGEYTMRHNAHFDAHPNHVLGRYEPGGAYRRENLNVVADQPAHQLLATALSDITAGYNPQGAAPQQVRPVVVSSSGRRLPAGSITTDVSSPTGFSRDGAPHKVTKKGRPQLASLCELRDHALDYLAAPSDEGRSELADLYAAYTDRFAPLNTFELRQLPPKRRAAGAEVETTDPTDTDDDDEEVIGNEITRYRRVYPSYDGFRRDPSWWTVAALEDHDDETMTATPAPILQHPVIDDHNTDRWPTRAESLTLAVANSLARYHRIDQDYIAGQLDTTIDEARDHLTAVAFENPDSGGWEVSATYLAGDVVGKLDTATNAATSNPRYARNVEALTAVQPTPLTQAEIVPELGVTWLTAENITQFVRDTAGSSQATVLYHPPTGQWSSEGW